MMNNRRCHSLRSAAVFPCSLLKLITDLKKVTVRGIESRLRRVRGSRGGVMTGAPEEEEKQHSISVMEISAFMIYYWWSQHEGRPGILSVYVDLVTTGEPGAWCLGPGVSTCELSRAPESGPGLREAATRGRDFSPGPGLTCDETRVAGPGRGGAETAIWTSFLQFSGCNSAPRKKKPTSVTMIRLASMNVGHAARISEIILFVGAKNGPWMAAKSR